MTQHPIAAPMVKGYQAQRAWKQKKQHVVTEWENKLQYRTVTVHVEDKQLHHACWTPEHIYPLRVVGSKRTIRDTLHGRKIRGIINVKNDVTVERDGTNQHATFTLATYAGPSLHQVLEQFYADNGVEPDPSDYIVEYGSRPTQPIDPCRTQERTRLSELQREYNTYGTIQDDGVTSINRLPQNT